MPKIEHLRPNANKTLSFRKHCGGGLGTAELMSVDTGEFVNIYLTGEPAGERGTRNCICAHPDDAKALRDALLEIYPVEQEKPKSAPWRLNYSCGEYVIGRDVVTTETNFTVSAKALSEKDARRIADALNAAEAA